jgi:hypothetical protein
MEAEGQQSVKTVLNWIEAFVNEPTQTKTPTLDEVRAACSELTNPQGEFLKFPEKVTAEYVTLSNLGSRMVARFCRMDEFFLNNESNPMLSIIDRVIFSNLFEDDTFKDFELVTWGFEQCISNGFNPATADRNMRDISSFDTGVSFEACNQEIAVRMIYQGVAQESILLQQKVERGEIELAQLCQTARANFMDLSYLEIQSVILCGFCGCWSRQEVIERKKAKKIKAVLAKMRSAMQQGLEPQQVLLSPEDCANLKLYHEALIEMFNSFTPQQMLVVISLKKYFCKVHEKAQLIRTNEVDVTDPFEVLKMTALEIFKNSNGKTVNVRTSRLVIAFVFQLRRLKIERDEALRAQAAGELLTDRQRFLLDREVTDFYNLCWGMYAEGEFQVLNVHAANGILVGRFTLEEILRPENELYFQLYLAGGPIEAQFRNLQDNLEARLQEFRTLMPKPSDVAKRKIAETIFKATDFKRTVGWLREIDGRLFRSEMDFHTGVLSIIPVVLDATV